MRKNSKRRSKACGPWKRFVKCMDLPEFAEGLDECVEIWGGNTVQIEGAKGIHTYEQNVVKVHMNRYLLVIRGADFDLAHFSDGALRVMGKLQNISWEVE